MGGGAVRPDQYTGQGMATCMHAISNMYMINTFLHRCITVTNAHGILEGFIAQPYFNPAGLITNNNCFLSQQMFSISVPTVCHTNNCPSYRLLSVVAITVHRSYYYLACNELESVLIICDEKHLIFECAALALLRQQHTDLFTPRTDTMRSFSAGPSGGFKLC